MQARRGSFYWNAEQLIEVYRYGKVLVAVAFIAAFYQVITRNIMFTVHIHLIYENQVPTRPASHLSTPDYDDVK